MIEITNATLVSIAAPPVSDNDGGETASSPVAVGVRVLLDAPKDSASMSSSDKRVDVTAVMYAPIEQADALVDRAVVSVLLDGRSTPRGYQVASSDDRVNGGGLSHVEVYLKGR